METFTKKSVLGSVTNEALFALFRTLIIQVGLTLVVLIFKRPESLFVLLPNVWTKPPMFDTYGLTEVQVHTAE